MRDGQVRVLLPSTGKYWEFRPPATLGGDVTDDGRFVMLWCRRQIPEGMQPLLRLFPHAGDGEYVAIYERPGKLRAVLRRVNFNSWWISPDGHAIAVSDFSQVRLYRW